MARGGIAAVRNLFDSLPHQALRVIKQGGTGGFDRLEPVALDEFDITLRTDATGCDLSLHIANYKIRDANIIAQQLPHRGVPVALLKHLDRLELQTLGIGIKRLNNAGAARCLTANIEMVGRGNGKTDELIPIENRHPKPDIRAMAGTAIRVVMHDDVAG